MKSPLAVLAMLAGLAACKGDPDKCERAVRNYSQLVYWQEADAEIAATAPDRREAVRKKKLAAFEAELQRSLDTIVSKCTSANNDDMTNCMIEAKTGEQAKACTK
ncbi:MAG: hypothetical protein JWO36_3717 [Myxococcales bacterium]|nr:hypothetical protein [Myxococcales bacterium]